MIFLKKLLAVLLFFLLPVFVAFSIIGYEYKWLVFEVIGWSLIGLGSIALFYTLLSIFNDVDK